jgi:hypothetical protein
MTRYGKWASVELILWAYLVGYFLVILIFSLVVPTLPVESLLIYCRIYYTDLAVREGIVKINHKSVLPMDKSEIIRGLSGKRIEESGPTLLIELNFWDNQNKCCCDISLYGYGTACFCYDYLY